MSSTCRFCKRTFSNISGLSQHVIHCMLDQSTSSKESSLISDISNMSLESEGFLPIIEEIRN